MATFENCYDFILSGSLHTEKDAINFAMGFVWSEVDRCEQTNIHYNYIDTVNGIDVYYNFGADYYFFCDSDG